MSLGKRSGGAAAVAVEVTAAQPPRLPERSSDKDPAVDRYYKVVLVGNSGVGKTSLCNTLDGKMGASTISTIGNNHMSKTYRMEGFTAVMQLWDTAGVERFAHLTRTYFQKARAIMLAYAVNDRASYEAISERWRRDMDAALGPKETGETRVFLIANKVDLPKHEWKVTREEALQLCAPYGWYLHESSAMNQQLTDQLFTDIIRALINEDNANRVVLGRVTPRDPNAPLQLREVKKGNSPRPEGARAVTGTFVTANPNGSDEQGGGSCGC